MMTETKSNLFGAEMSALLEENIKPGEFVDIEMTLPIQALFDDFMTFISKVDFE